MCSLRGDCSWAILHNSNISPVTLLRLLRFFRIMWILKHVKFMRITTLLGGLAVSTGGGSATSLPQARWGASNSVSIALAAACGQGMSQQDPAAE